jgi:hypothetical protein
MRYVLSVMLVLFITAPLGIWLQPPVYVAVPVGGAVGCIVAMIVNIQFNTVRR